MNIEEARIKLSIIKNSYSIRNYFCTDMTHQEKALIDYENLVIGLIKEKQELIEYLKEQIKEQEHKSKFLDFGLDIIHNKVKIMTYQEILSKIEKSGK